ncbi:hypothetical protein I7I51_05480 [Histoplasma capsulatum]|uniref:Uncharacterized protein n=1 Tax=Ajellomyces capsulatus TaxID=5037 RepID=A0A8A1M3R9_AJECA|nr:hypothetical protein I7I51_05480 [Histoplasma capsulatum]
MADIEQEREKSNNKQNAIDIWSQKLQRDAETIKILERLAGRGPQHVRDAISILKSPQSTRESSVYQLFLHDILRLCDRGLVVLCAASLGKQRVAHLAEDERTGLVGYVKENKSLLGCLALESLANDYQVPLKDDPQLINPQRIDTASIDPPRKRLKRPTVSKTGISPNPLILSCHQEKTLV